jgi:hypothetical protein
MDNVVHVGFGTRADWHACDDTVLKVIVIGQLAVLPTDARLFLARPVIPDLKAALHGIEEPLFLLDAQSKLRQHSLPSGVAAKKATVKR